MAGLRSDLTMLEQRVEEEKAAAQDSEQQHRATEILGAEAPEDIRLERAHRALGPPRQDGSPRNVICCFHLFSLREKIMAAARGTPSIQFCGTEVTLFQDLSSLTLDARRALRPVTSALRERRIPYRWGFPFSIHGNSWVTARWPKEIPGLLRTLNLPSIRVRNWILEEVIATRRDPLAPLRGTDTPARRSAPPRRRGGPDGPEE
ncbi:Hypothetical predicted protein [Pelobates cultripes]|uniref:Uncharacterized protein n=1 Tax=Pelobates cultripes TaxID=61616 RepID=A0AAD1T2T0_PELCU|nr:Hypothetical predicted protein [Pelobates cultripes]